MNPCFIPLHPVMFLSEGISIPQGVYRTLISVFWGGVHVCYPCTLSSSVREKVSAAFSLSHFCKACPDTGSSLMTFMLLLLPINEKKCPPLSLAPLPPLIPWRLMGEDERTQRRLQQGGSIHFHTLVLSQHIGSTCCLVATARIGFSRWRGKVFTWGTQMEPRLQKKDYFGV